MLVFPLLRARKDCAACMNVWVCFCFDRVLITFICICTWGPVPGHLQKRKLACSTSFLPTDEFDSALSFGLGNAHEKRRQSSQLNQETGKRSTQGKKVQDRCARWTHWYRRDKSGGTKKKSDLKISPEADGTRSGAGMPLASPPDSARVRTSPDSFRLKLNVHRKE